MPCRDYYDDHPDQYFRDVTEPGLKKQISFAESALCQTLTALEKVTNESPADYGDFYNLIDFTAAGITKAALVKWHKNHKELDAKHRAAEEAKKTRAELKKAALSKLSKAEREVLGI